MARPVRMLIPDGWHHVFGRGREQRRIFRDDRDREHFLELPAALHDAVRRPEKPAGDGPAIRSRQRGMLRLLDSEAKR